MPSEINIKAKREKNVSILESILKSRKIDNFEEFFNPCDKKLSSPYSFSDMKKAVEILKEAIVNKDKILIWGDFDADGVTSVSILYKTFSALGADFIYFIPDRDKLGHGINLNELLNLKSKNNVKVLITVDCGISNAKEINLIKTMGTKVIITDHHEPPLELPNADCILNPVCPNSLSSDLSVKDIEKISLISGAGVSFMLASALLEDKFPDVYNEVLAISSIGTISDVVPLLGENRIIAAKGLELLSNGINKGVKRLFENQNIIRDITSEDIAFILAPRINAAGRLDSPLEALKLLIEDSDLVLDIVIEKLNSLNKVRQNLCDVIYQEALSMVKNPSESIVLYHPNWHLGIIGIVASRLIEKFNLPVFLITKDDRNILRCSIRGTKPYDISEILKSIKECFLGYGGHSFAGGFSADPDAIDIDVLIKKIKEAVINNKDESKENFSIEADIELNGDEINFDLIDDIKKMEPFGEANPKPKFFFDNAELISQKQIGKDGKHLSYRISKDDFEFNCLYWKRKVLGIKNGEKISFIFHPEVNEFNGIKRIQLISDRILNDKIYDDYATDIKIYDHRQKTDILDKIDDYVKNKAGEVKIIANSVNIKKILSKYKNITDNIISTRSKQTTIMLFDYPYSFDDFQDLIKNLSPKNIHLMKYDLIENPFEYFTMALGMIKFATKHKNANISLKMIANNLGIDEFSAEIIILLLEKTESIQIQSEDKILYLSPLVESKIRNDSAFEDFSLELKRINEFKKYLLTLDIEEMREICKI